MDKSPDERVSAAVPAFGDGLESWCLETDNGQRCQCDQIETVAYVPADHDFGGCLEFSTTGGTQFLHTAFLPALVAKRPIGVRFSLKAVGGPLPTLSIAARPTGQHCDAMLRSDPALLDRHQKVTTVFAVIGMGTDSALPVARDIGLCVTGAAGGTLRVADVDVFNIALVV